MKDEALRIARDENNPKQAKNRLREYLQHVILRQLFEQGLTDRLIFHGGTALRIVYGLRRFSEDLDFHLAVPDSKFSLEEILPALVRGLRLSGYETSLKDNTDKTVQSMFVKFTGLLYEAGISPHSSELLSVNIEVDTNPPAGFLVERTMVNIYFPFAVKHHDQSTFLAGKLHAVFQRKYTKGRDWYDLAFYLSRWRGVAPNVDYLNNALLQTGWEGVEVSKGNWRSLVADKSGTVNWQRIREDVAPFIESEADLDFLQEEMFRGLLSA